MSDHAPTEAEERAFSDAMDADRMPSATVDYWVYSAAILTIETLKRERDATLALASNTAQQLVSCGNAVSELREKESALMSQCVALTGERDTALALAERLAGAIAEKDAVIAALMDGYTVRRASLFDGEGVDGWAWEDPAGNDAGWAIGGDAPTLPDANVQWPERYRAAAPPETAKGAGA